MSRSASCYLPDVVLPDDDCTNVRRGRVAPVRPVGGEPERARGSSGDVLQVCHKGSAPRKPTRAGRCGVAPKALDKARDSTSSHAVMMAGVSEMMAMVTPVMMPMMLCPGGTRCQCAQKRER